MTKILFIGPDAATGAGAHTSASATLRVLQLRRVLESSGHTVVSPDAHGMDAATQTTDCIVAVGDSAAAQAAELATKLPMWVDLPVHEMAVSTPPAEQLAAKWQRRELALRRSDRFSVSTFKQMYATLGELATVGRLNEYTTAHSFVSVVPPAADDALVRPPATAPLAKRFRGSLFPDDAFVLLWVPEAADSSDAKTLAAALSLAMEQERRVRIATVAIDDATEAVTESFHEELAKASFADRAYRVEDLQEHDLARLLQECSLAVNVDLLGYEPLFGSRPLLMNMLAAGLPVLATLATELSEIIDENRLGYVLPIGDVQGISDSILRAQRNPAERRQISGKAKKFCQENWAPHQAAKSLLRWVGNPVLAPDNVEKLRRSPSATNVTQVALSDLEQQVLPATKDYVKKALEELPKLQAQKDTVETELRLIKSSSLYSVLKPFIRG